MKKILSVIISAAILCGCICVTGCSADSGEGKIIATLFPQYSFAKQIAGDKYEVELLLTPGTESHTYDPSTADAYTISQAALFLYTGDEMEPWAANLLASLGSDCPETVNCSDNVELYSDEHDEHDHDHEGHSHGADPHIWLDMSNACIMADNICNGLCEIDPQNAAYYRENTAKLKTELMQIDREFETLFENADTKTIVFGGRFSYIYFIERYGLSYVSAYKSCDTAADPSLSDIAEVVSYIKSNDVKVIYHEELTDPKVARSIAEETGIEMREFSTGHNVTAEQLKSGVTFQNIMYQNLENLREGLCA